MPTTVRLAFPRVMDIRSVAAPRLDMMQAIEDDQDLELDLSAVEEADLTLVQLILSARLSAAERKLSFVLARPAPAPVMRILERGGFIDPAPDARRDFWLAA